ncbi:MAG: xanthine dehydrogenase family protein [Candidatus Rokuibacteriota bacterium]|nr:MAG: xanthine dehydrogenase family protein [Candidatus Rokubacteria bacterium]
MSAVNEHAAIGRSVPRVDGAGKVTGVTRFAGDVQLPGMVHARLVVSPHAHARLVRIETSAARAVAGVIGVFTGKDLPLPAPDAADRHRAPLALDRVVFNGHPVVAVVAETEAIAEDAATLVEVEYEPLTVVTDPLEAMKPESPRVRERLGAESEEELAMHGADPGAGALAEAHGPNVASTLRFTRGDVEAGLREADVVVEQRYHTSMVHQGYLVPEHRVRVVAMPIGGGFGGKFVLLEPLAAALTVAVHRPVSIVMSRSEEFLATTPAPPAIVELTTGARRDGTLTALRARVIFDAGAFPGAPTSIACLLVGAYYRFPHLDIRGYEVVTHKPGSGAYRAPGAVQATFAIESQMDALAARLGMDPLDLRLRNAVAEGDPMPNGRPWPRMGLRAVLEELRRRRDARRPAPPDGGRVLRGVGIAVGGWLGGIEPASAVCRINHDGSVSVVVGSVDLSGTNTALTQIAAEAFGVPIERVAVVNADTETAPYAGASGGSKITYTVGAAVQRAAGDARRQLLAIAADQLEAAAEDLELVDGHVRVRGVPDRAIAVAKLAQASMEFGGKYEPIFGRGASATTQRAPAFAGHLSEVEIEADTGAVRVVHHVVIQDVGRALNPAAVEGQMQGGVAQGVGWALLERMDYDEHGQLRSGTLMDYALPHPLQVPMIQPVILELPSEAGPFGAKGVGEPPVVAAGAAIANAVAAATNHRFTELPITSEAVRRALEARR